MPVLAKSNPPMDLRDHLLDVQRVALTLLTPARLAAFSRMGIGEQQASDLMLTTAWLHDFGKATREWQDTILSKRKLPQHSLTSFYACLWAQGVANVRLMSPEQMAVALAVLGHHGQLSKESFQRENFQNQKVTFLVDTWGTLAAELPTNRPLTKLPPTAPAERICTLVEQAKAICPDMIRQMPFRGLYCLLLTLLISADHAASGQHLPSPPRITEPSIPGSKTSFQSDVQSRPEEILCAIAGCGSGKTAAALLRAAEFAHWYAVDRIVLCLPTRFTSNSLLRDMSDPKKYAYPKHQVGLVHAEALQVLRSLHSEDEEDFPNTPEEERSKAVRYEHPITVSTVDHLLMSLYHGYRYSDRAFGNLMSSLVVFDEVHAYDATTLNAIREGLEILKRHSIPTLFMSATLPSSRRRFFGIGDPLTVIEQDNPFRPFIIKKLSAPLTQGSGLQVEATDATRELLRQARGLKLAIYVNQVERAKALARAAREEIPNTRVFCYHSELTSQDRIRLEKRILRFFRNRRNLPVVLVATQAAELSLDISAERMITELAPADVLVQRAGRLHRRGVIPIQDTATGRLPAGFVYELLIAPLDLEAEPDKIPPAALPYQDVSLLKRTWQTAPWEAIFDFASGLTWCENSLTEEPPLRTNGLLVASECDAAFGNKPQQNFGEDSEEGLVTIRDRDEDTMPVIPEVYFNKLGSIDTLDEITKFQVPLRRKKFWSLQKEGFIVERKKRIVLAKGHPRYEKIIEEYPFHIVLSNLPYNPNSVGFDFRIHDGEMIPQADTENFW